ncbi:MAG: 50S ribosomal protein P1 [Nitrososphaeria archaeon]|jgi:LSU ribosomal protein L12AE
MDYVYAALFLHSAGKEINEENLKKLTESVGAPVDEIKIKALVAALKQVNIDEILKSAVAAPVSQAPAAQQQAPAQQAAQPKEEKKEEEEKKGEALEGLAALFG